MPGIKFDFDEQSAALSPALQMLFQTYTDLMPYPHKFNDALLKAHLVNLDFAIKHNIWKEHAEHEVYILGPILEMIKSWIPEQGLDRALYGMFEGNSCNYQLFEKIEVKDCERILHCPYKEMLEIVGSLGTFNLTWEDVHEKWCIPLWKGFAEKIGIEIEVIPGEKCCVRIKK
jgi:hypothetical protein